MLILDPRIITKTSGLYQLNADQNVTEVFSIATTDGGSAYVTVNITGTNDVATLSSAVASLTESNAQLTTSGTLALSDLRGYATLDAAFGPGPHLVYGPNAAGKTSLLEAIVLLAWGRSHRTATDVEAIVTTFFDEITQRLAANGRVEGRLTMSVSGNLRFMRSSTSSALSTPKPK